jgi:GrpB-like predicted nucleotidyltransferase (UPF0157 family)
VTTPTGPLAPSIRVLPSDAAWPQYYQSEAARIWAVRQIPLVAMEHIGSTAVPGLVAKPVIDIMAAVTTLPDPQFAAGTYEPLGYALVETGMPERLFFRRSGPEIGCAFHLHLVTASSWPERNERLLRDYLLTHPEDAQAYGRLKEHLASTYADDGLAYTKAKTAFIQSLVDRARDARGLPRVDVWEA